MEKDMKDGYTGKIGDLMKQYREFQNSKTKIKNLTEPGDENENKIKTTKVEYDGEKDSETGEPQQQKCGKLMPNADTNDTICYNSSTSASNGNNKNNNNDNKDGEEEVTNMETSTVATNDRQNGEALEAKVERENSNSSNGIGSSSSTSKSSNCAAIKF